MDAIPCEELNEHLIITKKYKEFDVIGIDEGQFFDDIVNSCEIMAREGKNVIVAGLDATFQREVFGNLIQLIPLCEKVKKLSAICKDCYDSACFTVRTVSGQTEVNMVGG